MSLQNGEKINEGENNVGNKTFLQKTRDATLGAILALGVGLNPVLGTDSYGSEGNNSEGISLGKESNLFYNFVDNSGEPSLELDYQKITLSAENNDRSGTIVGIEYVTVLGKSGTIITVKSGSGFKSYLLTQGYIGNGVSGKVTVGNVKEDIEGVTTSQTVIGAELRKHYENFDIGAYVNKVNSDENDIFKGVNVYTVGFSGTNVFNPTSKIDWTASKNGGEINKGTNFSVEGSKIFGDNNKYELVWGFDGYNLGGKKSSISSIGLNYRFGSGAELGFNYEEKKGNDNDKSVGITLSIPLGGENNNRTPYTYNINKVNFDVNNFKHVSGTEQGVKNLYGTKKVNANNVVNTAPTFTRTTYNTGLTISDSSDSPQTILDLKTVSSDPNGDSITYSIVSVSPPNPSEQSVWNNAFRINNGVLEAVNLFSLDPDFQGNVSVVITASDGVSSNNTTVNFAYGNTR